MLTYSYCITVSFLILPLFGQERNATNAIDIRNENYRIAKFTAIILFTIFIFSGIINNALMAIVIFYHKKDNYYSHSFIAIVSQLIICDFIAFLPQMFVVLPEILQTKSNPNGKLFYYIINFSIN